VIPVPDAVPHKHAVMLPLEDADAARGAVPGPGRLHGLARRAKLPPLLDGRGQDDVPRRRVRQPQPDVVADNVDEEDGAEGEVRVVGPWRALVQFGEDDVDLEDEGGGDHEDDEAEGANVRDLAREDALAAVAGARHGRHL
jgi:hypothetical protein